MIISLLGIGSETLLSDLDSAGVKYIRHHPPAGVIINGPETIQIIKDISDTIPWGTIAVILIAWLKYRPSRRIQVKLEDNKILHIGTEGLSVEKFKDLLLHCQNITAIETKKPEE